MHRVWFKALIKHKYDAELKESLSKKKVGKQPEQWSVRDALQQVSYFTTKCSLNEHLPYGIRPVIQY